MARLNNRQNEISFEIVKNLGIIEKSNSGWTKEVNLVEWNGNPAKIDIREWDPEHEHMSKGITLHKKEVLELLKILNKWYGMELSLENAEKTEELNDLNCSCENCTDKAAEESCEKLSFVEDDIASVVNAW